MRLSGWLRYFFPHGSIKVLAVYGFVFSLAVAAIYYFHPETRGGPSVMATFIFFGLLFGVYAFMSYLHPEWGDWGRYGEGTSSVGGAGESASGGDSGGCGGDGGGCGGN